MTSQDLKKVAKIIKVVIDNKLDDEFYEKMRRIVRSEIEYALENSGGVKKQLNDDIPQQKIDTIREHTNSKKASGYVDPREKLKKMREMNNHFQDPDVDIYEDGDGNQYDLTENEKVKSLKNRNYGALLD